MSDPDSDLTPAQDDAVRALLASARHTDPTPPEVVARLDAALASLTADRMETRAPVVTLASRRRRTAGTLLLAAAAVVVAGVGIGQVLPTGGSDDLAGAGSDAVTSDSGDAAEGPMSAQESDEAYDAESAGPGDDLADEKRARSQQPAPTASQLLGEAGALSSDTALKPQVRRLRGAAWPVTGYAVCAGPDVGTGSAVPVTLDGLPATLVFRAPSGSRQRVDVFLCGEREAFRTLELRAP